ncbi:MAG: riboflavin synthase [Candidatus Omnitrophota bacterium]|nr:riboflavin synthase [Candidatus Omnitrophota bacterium]
MFTGIVRNLGVVKERVRRGGQVRFYFACSKREKKLTAGDSIAVNGVCLTVTKCDARGFWVDVIDETLSATSLGKLKKGARVNLERSLKYGDEVGGHFVTGHVDECGKIQKIAKRGKNRHFHIEVSHGLGKYLAAKGSVAIDGISLTVQRTKDRRFEIALIPFTLIKTTLGGKKVGDSVNVEVDLISRYMAKLLPASKSGSRGKVRLDHLKREGF